MEVVTIVSGVLTFAIYLLFRNRYSLLPVKAFGEVTAEVLDDPIFIGRLTEQDRINAALRYQELSGANPALSLKIVDYLIANPDEWQTESENNKHHRPMDAGVRRLIRDGKHDEAVRMYQGFTGVSADDARIEIERIQWEEGQRSR